MRSSLSINDVKKFWDDYPLFWGESTKKLGTRDFFEEHEKIVIRDCLANQMNDPFVSRLKPGKSILDIGCGIGFWVREFCRRNLIVYGCDLSSKAVELTRRSLKIYNLRAKIREDNAEELSYKDDTFDYINCRGVIHHTINTQRCVDEFFRVLKPGGLVCFSVYHRNLIIRSPVLMKLLAFFLSDFIYLKGRGREKILRLTNAEELVRQFDGKNNPIGKAFTLKEVKRMINQSNLEFICSWHNLFPARALPLFVPPKLHRLLNNQLGLMINFLAKKPID